MGVTIDTRKLETLPEPIANLERPSERVAPSASADAHRAGGRAKAGSDVQDAEFDESPRPQA